jgi:hypothetical protein
MPDEQFFTSTESAVDATDYQRLIERFDLLWESAPSIYKQREMRKLLALINRYEASQHNGNLQRHHPAARDVAHPPVFNSV